MLFVSRWLAHAMGQCVASWSLVKLRVLRFEKHTEPGGSHRYRDSSPVRKPLKQGPKLSKPVFCVRGYLGLTAKSVRKGRHQPINRTNNALQRAQQALHAETGGRQHRHTLTQACSDTVAGKGPGSGFSHKDWRPS